MTVEQECVVTQHTGWTHGAVRGALVALLLISAGVACGSGDDGAPENTTATTVTTVGGEEATTTAAAPTGGESAGMDGGEVTDSRTVAEYFANTAVAFGEQGFDVAAIAEATVDVYPDLSIVGSALPADASTVSANATVVDDKDVASTDNPGIVAFAVKDTSGRCTGIAVVGHPAPEDILRFEGEAGDDCTADEMIAATIDQLDAG